MNKNIIGLGDVYEIRRASDERKELLSEKEKPDCGDCYFLEYCSNQCGRKYL
jgi:radical SAM protein with 4Fe4S-binding SPASM domain